MPENRDRELLKKLCINNPWSWSTEGLDDCCMFCTSEDREYANGKYIHRHLSDCPWMDAVEYLGLPHSEHVRREQVTFPFGKCAVPNCEKEAIGDAPRMCATHTLSMFGMLGSLWNDAMREAHFCPFGDWAVAHNGLDLEGVEACIEDHLNTEHLGWTIAQIEELSKSFDASGYAKGVNE